MKSRLFLSLIIPALAACLLNSCTSEVQETLEVSPASISFEAAGNENKVLKVTTNASDWSFVNSSWIEGSKSGDELVVNCKDNTSLSPREGWLRVSAGAAEPVVVKVTQKAAEPQQPSGEPVSLVSVNGVTDIKVKDENEITLSVAVSLPSPAENSVTVKLVADYDYLDAFNKSDLYHFRKAVLLESGRVTLPENVTVTIPAGRSESEALSVKVDVSGFAYDERHLLPLSLEVVENAAVSDEGRANFVLTRPKPIKNVVIYEVNETNPLNSLEYKLEDGSYFFDSAVLFSSNIIDRDGEPRLSNNANVQALLDQCAVYVQPLRDAGIKVYLGLLGHHTIAGLGNLSDKGARLFAEEVAEACYIYGLDGVFLDDEYTSYPETPKNDNYTDASLYAAGRLCYELKRAMKMKCPWETEVSYWVYGNLRTILYPVVDDGVEHPVSSFIDIVLPGYGGVGRRYADLTNANCGVAAYELNKGSVPRGELGSAVADGYGYCMWFCFHPSDKGTISNNLNRSLGGFRDAAQAFYGQTVLAPKNYYDKLGEGSFDPNPHAF